MRPLGQNASDLGQSKADDNDFAVVQFSGSGGCHHFTRENFWHGCLPGIFIPEMVCPAKWTRLSKFDEELQARFTVYLPYIRNNRDTKEAVRESRLDREPLCLCVSV